MLNDPQQFQELSGDGSATITSEPDLPQRSRPWLTILLTLLVMGAYVLAQSVAIGVIFGIELQQDERLNLDEWMYTNQYDGDVLAICTIASAVITIPLVFGAAYLLSRRNVRETLALRLPTAKQAVIWLIVVVAHVALTDGITWLVGKEIVPPFMREAYLSSGVPIFLWLALTVAAPLTEELLFRGLLFGGLRTSRVGPVGAAIISSAVWTAIHVQYDFFHLVPVFVGGLLLAASRQSTNSIAICILMHSVWNAIATIEAVWLLRNG